MGAEVKQHQHLEGAIWPPLPYGNKPPVRDHIFNYAKDSPPRKRESSRLSLTYLAASFHNQSYRVARILETLCYTHPLSWDFQVKSLMWLLWWALEIMQFTHYLSKAWVSVFYKHTAGLLLYLSHSSHNPHSYFMIYYPTQKCFLCMKHSMWSHPQLKVWSCLNRGFPKPLITSFLTFTLSRSDRYYL